jgi:hypothetical protein
MHVNHKIPVVAPLKAATSYLPLYKFARQPPIDNL